MTKTPHKCGPLKAVVQMRPGTTGVKQALEAGGTKKNIDT
jgi:hypothetical protein